MGVLLLLTLSLIFAWAFTSHYDTRIKELRSQVLDEQTEKARQLEQFQYEKRILQNTIRELLEELRGL